MGPRSVLVSHQLFPKLRLGVVPWPDGGECSDDLREILMRQFDLLHTPTKTKTDRDPRVRSADDSPSRAGRRPPIRRTSSGTASVGGQPRPSPEPEKPKQEEPWADKLKRLQRNVNTRSSDSLGEEPARKRRL